MKLLALPLAVLALTLGGCVTADSTGTTSEPASGSNRPATSNSASPEPEPSTSASPVNPKFGETYTWDDGLQVTISAPTPFTPSESAMTGEAAAYLAFQVTVVNGSAANYEAAQFYTTLQSANVEAEEVFDSEQGFEGSPMTPLLPGREATFKIGYGVQDPADLVMQVTPTFEHEAVIFTS